MNRSNLFRQIFFCFSQIVLILTVACDDSNPISPEKTFQSRTFGNYVFLADQKSNINADYKSTYFYYSSSSLTDTTIFYKITINDSISVKDSVTTLYYDALKNITNAPEDISELFGYFKVSKCGLNSDDTALVDSLHISQDSLIIRVRYNRSCVTPGACLYMYFLDRVGLIYKYSSIGNIMKPSSGYSRTEKALIGCPVSRIDSLMHTQKW